MITVINKKGWYGSSVDLQMLPDSPTVLDLGCRGYDYVDAILEVRPNAIIVAVDVDPKAISRKDTNRVKSICAAVVPKKVPCVRYIHPNQEQATFVDYGYPMRKQDKKNPSRICHHTLTVSDILDTFRLSRFDLIKMDIEGGEYGILESMTAPWCVQLNVAFHDQYPGRVPGGDADAWHEKNLVRMRRMGYLIASHRRTGPMWMRSYHDSLFVLRRVQKKSPVARAGLLKEIVK